MLLLIIIFVTDIVFAHILAGYFQGRFSYPFYNDYFNIHPSIEKLGSLNGGSFKKKTTFFIDLLATIDNL